MTDPTPRIASRLARRLLPPLFDRIDAVRHQLAESEARVDRLAASCEQLHRQVERLEAFQQVSRDEARAEFTDLVSALPDVGDDVTPAIALRSRLDHALLHAESLTLRSREQVEAELAAIRSSLRLSQAMAERALKAAPGSIDGSGGASTSPGGGSAAGHVDFDHAAPSFEVLYRGFEDRHRGAPELIRAQQDQDYGELLASLGSDGRPIVDLGCGRGELVDLLHSKGVPVIGVDANLGQVEGGDAHRFVERDLFRWLDEREDASCAAVVALHVIEHLPPDLQVRLVFEAHRVVVAGGLLVLETPNTLSLSTAATNFWVDPTHQRPVHPLFLEFLAVEAGFVDVRTEQLHPLPVGFRGAESAPELVDDLDSLIFGAGDLALVARR